MLRIFLFASMECGFNVAMLAVGIDAIGFYGGGAFVDVRTLALERGLDQERFNNLLMDSKTVSLNFEDPVSFAVNAARPIVEALSAEEKATIDLLIVATESGVDFGKSLSAYVHHYLGLSRRCRLFEIKQACFAGTAALQTATAHVRTSPGRRALIICTDVARPVPHTYAEPSQGAAAVAMLVSESPAILELEQGARGNWSYEVMDSCRPTAEIEIGDPDLSVLCYLDCLKNSFAAYRSAAGLDVNLGTHFDALAFHTPFGGMVRGAHRALMRSFCKGPPEEIEADFNRRVAPSLEYCKQVGNIYSGALYLALCGLLDNSTTLKPGSRLGLFSYGSGCSSEFFSGIISSDAKPTGPQSVNIATTLQARQELNMTRYDELLALNRGNQFGEANWTVDFEPFNDIYEKSFHERGLLVLTRVENYHRVYAWT